ncbi:hypothetical protein Tco_1467111 [Tanacetum coccineum]
MYYDDQNMALLQTFDLTVHVLDSLRREMYYELYSTAMGVQVGSARDKAVSHSLIDYLMTLLEVKNNGRP